MTILNELLQLAADSFNVEKKSLHPDDDFFQTLNIDSLQAVNFLSDIESHFKIEIPDYELKGVTTFQQLADIISKRC